MQLFKRKFMDHTTVLIVSNEETEDVMKIVKSLEESELLKKRIRISEQWKRKEKNKKADFFNVILNVSW